MGKKILLADDSITIQKVIELTFSDEDFEVVTVGNGRLAIEKVQEVRPDVVLCDIIMPEKDGYEVCDFVKKNPALSHIPVLLLTGAFEPFDQERAARVGCDGFLAKPFEPQTLIAKVKDLLSQAASRQPAAAASAPAPRPAVAPPPAPPIPTYVAPPPSLAAHEPAPEPPAVEPLGFDAMSFDSEPAAPGAYEPVSFDVPEAFDMPEAEPAPAPASTPAPSRAPAPAPAASFVSEDAFAGEIVEEATFADAMDLPAEPEPPAPPPAYEPAPAVQDSDLYAMPETLDEPVEDLMALPADEPVPIAPEPESELAEDDASTVMFHAAAAPWAQSQPTVEVPLETRAQASREAQLEAGAPMFEEVFEEEPTAEFAEPPGRPAPAPAPRPAVAPSAPAAPSAPVAPPVAAAAPAAAPTLAAPEPFEAETVPELEEGSFEDVVPVVPAAVAPPAPAPSEAAQVAVPMDMVAQIAQRVVGQLSEKVVREVAWEIIPDLAEALIKKEIERLKAELQQT